jgi:psp operon transcriptional activator
LAAPGNVRELKNVVERAVYRTDAALITDIIFDPFTSPPGAGLATVEAQTRPPEPETVTVDASETQPFLTAVRAFEIRLLRQALREARYHQKKAAQRLGLTYHQLRDLCRKYGKALIQG